MLKNHMRKLSILIVLTLLIYFRSEGFSYPHGKFLFDWISLCLLLLAIGFAIFDIEKLARKIGSVKITHPTFGELLIEVAKEKGVLKSSNENILEELDASDVWFLYDIQKLRNDPKKITNPANPQLKNGLLLSIFNPVQKFIAIKLIKLGLVMKEGEIIQMTEEGKKVLELSEQIRV